MINGGEVVYYRIPFPTAGTTIRLMVDLGRVICYASDVLQNPNEDQGYEWRVETNSSAEVFIGPSLLDRDPGVYIYIGLEGGSSSNEFRLNSTSGDRRSKSKCKHFHLI